MVIKVILKLSQIGYSKKKYLKTVKDIRCSKCNIGDIWNNKPIVLQMDHIDGDSSNNNLDNLRLLCPNCHSQTPTFSTRTNKRKKITEQDIVDKLKILRISIIGNATVFGTVR